MVLREHELVASICRDSFFEFFREFWEVLVQEPLVDNWHIKYLCDELQLVAERVFTGSPKLYDLVINVPPGSTKSTICSQMFPAWVWTRMPHAQFICVSYAERISLKDALRMRDIVQSQKYQQCFPGIHLREDLNTKGLFKNTRKGYRLSAGLGGQVTGEHGHFLIVDDPLDPEEAHSDAELRNANRFMKETLPTRKVNKLATPTILVQQRLHQGDPSGEMLAAEKRAVKHICIPGELTEDVTPPELADYYVDGLFDPVRLPKEALAQQEEDLGAYGYAAQILQTPVPKGGGCFDVSKLQIVDDCHEQMVEVVRSWDKAGTDGGGAWSVGLKMGKSKRGTYWILDIERGQWASRKREDMIRTVAENDGEDVPVIIEIEGGSGGKESAQNSVTNLDGYRVITYHPTGDKETRAYPFSSQVGGGNVYVLNRKWTKAYIEEMKYFPNSKFKDQIDASSGAFNHIALKRRRKAGAF